jgi:hypothetical protein
MIPARPRSVPAEDTTHLPGFEAERSSIIERL